MHGARDHPLRSLESFSVLQSLDEINLLGAELWFQDVAEILTQRLTPLSRFVFHAKVFADISEVMDPVTEALTSFDFADSVVLHVYEYEPSDEEIMELMQDYPDIISIDPRLGEPIIINLAPLREE